jgi:hypothetical protein
MLEITSSDLRKNMHNTLKSVRFGKSTFRVISNGKLHAILRPPTQDEEDLFLTQKVSTDESQLVPLSEAHEKRRAKQNKKSAKKK